MKADQKAKCVKIVVSEPARFSAKAEVVLLATEEIVATVNVNDGKPNEKARACSGAINKAAHLGYEATEIWRA